MMRNLRVAGSAARSSSPGATLQRACACGSHTQGAGECEACKKKRQDTARLARHARTDTAHREHTDDAPASVHDVLRTAGRPLDEDTRALMEQRFGRDFSAVRVHDDARAAQSAAEVDALAYTVGQEVVFGAGQYAPGTAGGQRLLAHELAHVVQQGARWTGGGLAVEPADSAAEREAQAAALEPGARLGRSAGTAVQRQGTGATGGGSGSGSSAAPLAGLQNLTRLRFSLGPFNFDADLPSRVTASLPVSLRSRQILDFRLTAEAAGSFSFSATYDGIPQVRISLRAGVAGVGGDSPSASAGLTIQTTRTVCRAPSPESTRSSLQSAGERLMRAIEAVQAAPEQAEGETLVDVAARYGEVAAAIANIHTQVERARDTCREVPVFSFDFGARTPLAPAPGETDPSRAPYIGGGFTFHF